jgi:urease accessory protein
MLQQGNRCGNLTGESLQLSRLLLTSIVRLIPGKRTSAEISKMKTSKIVLPFLAMAVPSLAHAHVGIGETSGFLHGVSHPLTGIDHLCAMIAVGIWAAQTGGRAIWAVPLAFVSIMLLGGALGMAGVHFSFAETGVAISVLMLGVLIAAAVRLSLPASILIVGLFALCHGHAHGAEMPATASALGYAGGFALTTTLLHVTGISLGVGIEKIASARFVRFAGGAIAAFGIVLWIS